MDRTAYDICIERFEYMGDCTAIEIPKMVDEIRHSNGVFEPYRSADEPTTIRNLVVVVNTRERIRPVKIELIEYIFAKPLEYADEIGQMQIFDYRLFFVHQDSPAEAVLGFKKEITSYVFVY